MLSIAKAQGFRNLNRSTNISGRIRNCTPSRGSSCSISTPAIATRCMASCRSYSDACQDKLDVVPMESFRSASARPPIIHRRRRWLAPGRINVNEYAPEKRLLLNLEAIAYHEASLDITCNFRSRRNSRDCRRSANSISISTLYRGLGVLLRASGKRSGILSGPVQRIRTPSE